MAIELNKETGKVEMDLDTYRSLIIGVPKQIFSPAKFEKFLEVRYPDAKNYSTLGNEMGVEIHDLIKGRKNPSWRLCERLIEKFSTDVFMITLPTFNQNNPWDLNGEFLRIFALDEVKDHYLRVKIGTVVTNKNTSMNLATVCEIAKAIGCGLDRLYIGGAKLVKIPNNELIAILKEAETSTKNIFSHLLDYRGITQRHLATLLGTDQSSVSGWSKGGRRPKSDNYYKICSIMGTPIDYFSDWLTGEE
ncbi:HTH domain protein [Serratia phage Moabite]|uniref:HTH domain protein n=1 Tax=Serratia phage Moabite TaxID=2587814 RepID=A0A4Y5TNZ5_9CAUD|nr:HTH domain protein [Serratia phage Moabite]QDB71095.1 HTH domain protein [Serratia phage Moabite]